MRTQGLMFKDLRAGQRFIAVPGPRDGLYRGSYHVFTKLSEHSEGPNGENAVENLRGVLQFWKDQTRVIHLE